MPAFTTEQWAVLFLVLVLGWLLGLMSRSGSARYKRELAAERERRIEIDREHEARMVAANTRIAELERTAPAIGVGTAGGVAAAARGTRDDLSLIRGIDAHQETRLNDAGVHDYRDLARLTPADEAALEARLGLRPGEIARQEWREQAALLAERRHDEHRTRFA
jgi:predicted flap endonuclease-1-like 5' DNA nuclease